MVFWSLGMCRYLLIVNFHATITVAKNITINSIILIFIKLPESFYESWNIVKLLHNTFDYEHWTVNCFLELSWSYKHKHDSC